MFFAPRKCIFISAPDPSTPSSIAETRLAQFPFLRGLPTNAVTFIQGHGEPLYINGGMLWDISTYISFCPVTTSCFRKPERPRVTLNNTVSTYEQVEATIEVVELDRRSDIFKALGDRNRLKLLYLLMDGEKCVSSPPYRSTYSCSKTSGSSRPGGTAEDAITDSPVKTS
jgi:hypothetical protein